MAPVDELIHTIPFPDHPVEQTPASNGDIFLQSVADYDVDIDAAWQYGPLFSTDEAILRHRRQNVQSNGQIDVDHEPQTRQRPHAREEEQMGDENGTASSDVEEGVYEVCGPSHPPCPSHKPFPIRRPCRSHPSCRPRLPCLSQVEAIRAKRINEDESGELFEELLVHWRGYAHEDDTWVPRENILDGSLLREFDRRDAGLLTHPILTRARPSTHTPPWHTALSSSPPPLLSLPFSPPPLPLLLSPPLLPFPPHNPHHRYEAGELPSDDERQSSTLNSDFHTSDDGTTTDDLSSEEATGVGESDNASKKSQEEEDEVQHDHLARIWKDHGEEPLYVDSEAAKRHKAELRRDASIEKSAKREQTEKSATRERISASSKDKTPGTDALKIIRNDFELEYKEVSATLEHDQLVKRMCAPDQHKCRNAKTTETACAVAV